MKTRRSIRSRLLVLFWIVSTVSFAAETGDDLVEFGGEILTGYEERPTGATESRYSEAGGFFSLKNHEAVLDLDLSGEGYQRYNRLFEEAVDNRYAFQAGIGSAGNCLEWNVSSFIRRTLSSQTDYNPDTGQGPDDYLRSGAVDSRGLGGQIVYRIPYSHKADIRPYYRGYYREEDLTEGSERRMQHEAGVRGTYRYTERTGIAGEIAAQRQAGSEENGDTLRAGVGAVWRYSEKTSFLGLVGWMLGRYDESGSAHGPFFDLKGTWQATDKTSLYCFGGSRFRPGTEGSGAEQVWRVGYGGDWIPRDSWRISLQLLHQIQKPIADREGQEEDRSDYLAASVEKKLNKYIAAHGSVRYTILSNESAQSGVRAQMGMRFAF